MVSANLYTLIHTAENRVVAELCTGCCHSMINLREIGQLGTKRLADSLMTQTDAQHRLDTRIFFNNIHQKTSLRRNTRPRTQYNLIEWLQFPQLELVIAINRNFYPQLLHQMCQVIGKGIVIIYDYYFHLHYLLLIIY